MTLFIYLVVAAMLVIVVGMLIAIGNFDSGQKSGPKKHTPAK